ncbi:MAG: hypothetical protein QN183_09035 [Armatimonadota bacterium]|nr:hypothetical protein [Armatimonadota bacterium]MDR7533375.1 hypothetical protein [Armatimonadota bacterium]MDR7536495.1 hypothetical protein [Armatimonadota bacterium]
MKGTLRVVVAAIAAILLFGTTTLSVARQAPVVQIADGDMGGGL